MHVILRLLFFPLVAGIFEEDSPQVVYKSFTRRNQASHPDQMYVDELFEQFYVHRKPLPFREFNDEQLHSFIRCDYNIYERDCKHLKKYRNRFQTRIPQNPRDKIDRWPTHEDEEDFSNEKIELAIRCDFEPELPQCVNKVRKNKHFSTTTIKYQEPWQLTTSSITPEFGIPSSTPTWISSSTTTITSNPSSNNLGDGTVTLYVPSSSTPPTPSFVSTASIMPTSLKSVDPVTTTNLPFLNLIPPIFSSTTPRLSNETPTINEPTKYLPWFKLPIPLTSTTSTSNSDSPSSYTRTTDPTTSTIPFSLTTTDSTIAFTTTITTPSTTSTTMDPTTIFTTTIIASASTPKPSTTIFATTITTPSTTPSTTSTTPSTTSTTTDATTKFTTTTTTPGTFTTTPSMTSTTRTTTTTIPSPSDDYDLLPHPNMSEENNFNEDTTKNPDYKNNDYKSEENEYNGNDHEDNNDDYEDGYDENETEEYDKDENDENDDNQNSIQVDNNKNKNDAEIEYEVVNYPELQ